MAARRGAVELLFLCLGFSCALRNTTGEAQAGAVGGTGQELQCNDPHAELNGLGASEQDDSVRCRYSGICEGAPPAERCPFGPANSNLRGLDAEERDDALACITDPAERAQQVTEATAWSWKGYRECAWGWDELQPLGCQGSHWLNLSLTMVDSLDTLYLAGLDHEFREAADWVSDNLDVSAPGAVNLFETTIRIVGGLLSAHHLSRDSHPQLSAALGAKAAELGARLVPAFTASPSGIPYSDVNLNTGAASSPRWARISSLSEIGTLSLEFTHLARLTGISEYEEVALGVHAALTSFVHQYDGLLPLYFNPLSGKRGVVRGGGTVTLGARTDSYYEYLLKHWVLTGKREEWLRQRFVDSMRSVRARLVRRTAPLAAGGLLYVAERVGHEGGAHVAKMDHLVCFLPGLLALAHYHGIDTSGSGSDGGDGAEGDGEALGMGDLELAEALAHTCYELYRRTPSGLAPEIAHFSDQADGGEDYPKHHQDDVGHGHFTIKAPDAHNLLRPETVESLYVLWKVTGRPQYREWAWAIFRAFQKWCRVEGVEQCMQGEKGLGAQGVGAAQAETEREAQDQQDQEEEQEEHSMEQQERERWQQQECVWDPDVPGGARSGCDKPRQQQQQQQQQPGDDTLHAGVSNSSVRQVSEGSGGSSSREGVMGGGAGMTAGAGGGSVDAEGAALEGQDDRVSDLWQLLRRLAERATAMRPQAAGSGGDASPLPSATDSTKGCGSGGSAVWGGGYTNLDSVLSVPPPRRDKMESFWIAETLKYLYLTFAEPPERCLDESCSEPAAAGEGYKGASGDHTPGPAPAGTRISFQRYVFNTEAHPLPILEPGEGPLRWEPPAAARQSPQAAESGGAAEDGSQGTSGSSNAGGREQSPSDQRHEL